MFTYTTTIRFWIKVHITDPTQCWEWQGARRGDNYGQLHAQGQHYAAHRFSFYLANLYWPEVVRHKCDNRICVNPHHLEGGTQKDNMQDVILRRRHANQQKTHCPRGHEYTKENTFHKKNGSRECRACRKERKPGQEHLVLSEMWSPSDSLRPVIPSTDAPMF